jgi:hypothetical protein
VELYIHSSIRLHGVVLIKHGDDDDDDDRVVSILPTKHRKVMELLKVR